MKNPPKRVTEGRAGGTRKQWIGIRESKEGKRSPAFDRGGEEQRSQEEEAFEIG
jgi:hypothetical protein